MNSIRLKLLVMFTLLVLLTVLSVSITYYFLTKQDKHRESQQRIQIAFEIIFDDLARQFQFYTQRFDDYLQRDDTFRVAVNIYLQDQNPFERSVGLRPFLVSQLTNLAHIVSIDRLALYTVDGRLLAAYPDADILSTAPLDLKSTFKSGIPENITAGLFSENRSIGIRIAAPLSGDREITGVLIGDVFLTQDVVTRYTSLSKTEINFFTGEHLSLGTLPGQAALEPEALEHAISCDGLSEGNQRIEVVSITFDQQDYYQGRCLLRDAENTIGAITVSLSQEIEKQGIRKILTAIFAIAGTGIVVCFILVSSIVVPKFTGPIIRLTHAASEIAHGELKQDIDISGTDELGVLARSFAYMRDEIQKKIVELQQLNEKLEQRVKERTAEIARQQYILDTFMATVPDRIYFKDCQGRITRANMAHARRLGLGHPSEELGKTDFDFFLEEEASKRYKQEQKIIRTGQPLINQELSLLNSDGSIEWALVTKMPLCDENGTIIGTFGISRDITDLKQTEQELAQYRDRLEDLVEERTAELVRINARLQEEIAERMRIEGALRLSEEQYRMLAENATDGVVIVQENALVFSNAAFATMMGYSKSHLLKKKPASLFHDRSKASAHARLTADDKKFQDPRWQAELVTNDQRTIWSEIDQAGISWNGKPACLLTIRDITDRKIRENRLEEERARLRQENITLRSTVAERYKFGNIVGKSQAMQRIYELIVSAAASQVNVLICGESGTGKELIAHTIHQASARKEFPFVAVNCASIPETLFEREFFGHRKGTFTGATRDKPGLFDRAHRGVLFLDEVTELTPGAQAKLLRVLQDGEYIPLGSTCPQIADVLIVAATNKDWKTLIEQERLRKDFFYRICVIEIQVPPLRDRKDDLPFLIEHFLEQYSRKQQRLHGYLPHDLPTTQAMLSGKLVEALYAYAWPGNVRELQNVLQRYLATRDLTSVLSVVAPAGAGQARGDIQFPSFQGVTLPDAVQALEKRMIREVLAQNENHRLKTAEILGITRRALQYKLKKYGFLVEDVK